MIKDFSVIIPTYRAPSMLAALLEGLKAQSVRPREVIVIDSSPEEDTAQVAQAFGCRLLRISPEAFNHGLTRTEAARKARGKILVFFTQDARPAGQKTLAFLLEAFSSPGVAAAFGRQLAPPALGLWAELHRRYNYPPCSRVVSRSDAPRLGLRTVFFSNSFGAYRRNLLEEIGWFPPVPALEDVYVCARLLEEGYQVAYVAEALVWHGHHLSLAREFRRYKQMGAFYRQNPWILEKYGAPGGEGRKYVAFVWRELKKQGKRHLFPLFLGRQFVRLAGYLAGRLGLIP